MVTVFNRRSTPEGYVWYPSVFTGVDLNENAAVLAARYGVHSDDKVLLHVWYAERDGAYLVQGKRYLPPKAWQALEQPGTAFTFATGEAFDFFAVGDWGSEPVYDRAYAEGFYEFMSRSHDGVYAITSASRFSVIPHFEVTGR